MSGAPTAAQQQAYIQQLQTQMQQAMVQDMVKSISEKCLKICVGKDGHGLSSSEKKCLNNCVDRYSDTLAAVAPVIGKQLQG